MTQTRWMPGLGVRTGVIAVGAAFLLWLSVAISAAHFLQARQPELALWLWPADGIARANLAARMLSTNPRARTSVREEAARAWQSNPTAVVAVSLLAMVSSDATTAGRRFAYARRLSRRDISANIYYIDAAVRRNDISGALREYDIALSTSRSLAPQLLFPILDDAMAQPGITAPVGELLAQNSEWVNNFIAFSITRGRNIGALGTALAYRPQTLIRLPPEAPRQLLSMLADQGRFETAALLHWRLASPSHGPIRDPGFDREPQWPPFDWTIISAGSYGGSLFADNSRLRVAAEPGAGGVVARQLVRLAPGRHIMRSQAMVMPGASLGQALWSLTCAARDGRLLGSIIIAGREGVNQVQRAAIVVPGNCTWQWLSLQVANPNSGEPFEAAIDEIRIQPG